MEHASGSHHVEGGAKDGDESSFAVKYVRGTAEMITEGVDELMTPVAQVGLDTPVGTIEALMTGKEGGGGHGGHGGGHGDHGGHGSHH